MAKILSLVLTFLALSAPALAGDGWTALKPGMKMAEVVAKVGRPMVASVGRGYEDWFYDEGGEVMMFQGRVLYWHASASGLAATTPPAPVLATPTRPAAESVTASEVPAARKNAT